MRAYQSHRINRAILLALLISLLFHFTIFISFLYKENNKFDSDKNNVNTLLEQEKKNNPSWAARKARANQFGAPVIFQDEAEENKVESQTEQTESKFTNQKTSNNQELTQEIEEKSETTSTQKLLKVREKIPSEAIGQQIEKIVSKIKPPETTLPMQQSNPISSSKKSLTLAQLTKGFLEHIKDEGKDRITTEGQEGKIPTAEQLKHERYIEKLSWCLQNSFKINRDKFPATNPLKTKVKVYLALNQNGTVKELHIVESSGNRSLDQFTQFVFQDASSSFPPVPQYLPHDPYKIIYIIEINTAHDSRIGLHFL
jgi:outer membrane biosynthesis protein TonB